MMLQEVTEQKVKNKGEEDVNVEKKYIKYWKKKSVYDKMTRYKKVV